VGHRQANVVCIGTFTGRTVTSTTPEKTLSLQELPRRDSHFTNSLGGMSLHQFPRRDFNSKKSRGGTITPRPPEEGLKLQKIPRRDYHSKNFRGGTVTPRTPEKRL